MQGCFTGGVMVAMLVGEVRVGDPTDVMVMSWELSGVLEAGRSTGYGRKRLGGLDCLKEIPDGRLDMVLGSQKSLLEVKFAKS